MRTILATFTFVLFLLAPFAVMRVPEVELPTVETIVEAEAPLPLPGYPGCVARVDQLPPSPSRYDPEDSRLLADRVIVVAKKARRIMLFTDGEIRRDRAGGTAPDCWKVALGWREDGQDAGVFDKMMEGDRRTPEGWFRTSDRPTSSYENAILIHYPGERHAKTALKRGSITKSQYDQIAIADKRGTIPPQNTNLGGNILIHGGGTSSDWTWGCIALADKERDELRSLLPKDMSTWILILP